MRSTPCKGNCCKNPFGVCAKARNCACHISDRTMAEIERFNATSQAAKRADRNDNAVTRQRGAK